MRKELLADARTHAVGSHEDIPEGSCPISEVGADLSIFLELIAHECFVEMDDIVESGEQDLAEGQTVHGRSDSDELIIATLRERLSACFLDLTVDDTKHGHTPAGLASGHEEEVIQAGRQALGECLLASGVKMDAMALLAGHQPLIAFIHCYLHSCLMQPLSQR
jgi:hypothetical protein